MGRCFRLVSLAAQVWLLTLPVWGGDIAGTIVNRVTGAGIAGIQIELKPQSGLVWRTSTGASGEFQFAGLSAGKYTLSFDKDGFEVPTDETSTSTVDVTGEGTVRFWRELEPVATINGRVLDAEGNGVRRITVELLTGFGQTLMTVPTDDAGNFQVRHLTPGAYLLRATPNRAAWKGGVVSVANRMMASAAAARERRTLLAPAYYPGVRSIAEASSIRVQDGGELFGFDIRLRPSDVSAVRGRVLDRHGEAAANTTVKLMSADEHYSTLDGASDAEVTADVDGGFEFPTVAPGKWYVVAESRGPGVKNKAFQTVEVTRRDIENATLRLAEPITLDVTVEGLPEQDSRRRGPQVHLVPVDGPGEQEVYSDTPRAGKIQVQGVYPGRYLFYEGGRTGYFLDAIQMGQRNVLGAEVELSEGAPPVRLVYRTGGGEVRGTVEGGAGSLVVMVPEEESLREQWVESKCDGDGRFSVGDLRPGSYYAVAVRLAGALWDREWMDAIGRLGRRVQVGAGEKVAVELGLAKWPR